jgi:hypothetical protein
VEGHLGLRTVTEAVSAAPIEEWTAPEREQFLGGSVRLEVSGRREQRGVDRAGAGADEHGRAQPSRRKPRHQHGQRFRLERATPDRAGDNDRNPCRTLVTLTGMWLLWQTKDRRGRTPDSASG